MSGRLLEQLGDQPLGVARSARLERSPAPRARAERAERTVEPVWPYCAVGRGQRGFVQDAPVLQVDGNLDSPLRDHRVEYRRPHRTAPLGGIVDDVRRNGRELRGFVVDSISRSAAPAIPAAAEGVGPP